MREGTVVVVVVVVVVRARTKRNIVSVYKDGKRLSLIGYHTNNLSLLLLSNYYYCYM